MDEGWLQERWASTDDLDVFDPEKVLWHGLAHQQLHGMTEELEELLTNAALMLLMVQACQVGADPDVMAARLFDGEPTLSMSIGDEGLEVSASWPDDPPGVSISVTEAGDGREVDVALPGPTLHMKEVR